MHTDDECEVEIVEDVGFLSQDPDEAEVVRAVRRYRRLKAELGPFQWACLLYGRSVWRLHQLRADPDTPDELLEAEQGLNYRRFRDLLAFATDV